MPYFLSLFWEHVEKFISTKTGVSEFYGSLAGGRVKKFFDDLSDSAKKFLWSVTLEDIRHGFDDAKQSMRDFCEQFGIHTPTLWDFWRLIDTVATGVWNLGEKFQNARGKIANFFGGLAVPSDVKADRNQLWLNGQLADDTVEAAANIEGGVSRIRKAFEVLVTVLDYVIDAGVHVVSRLTDIFAPVWDMFVKGISEIVHSTSDLSILDVLKAITMFMNYNMYATISTTLDAIGSLSTAVVGIARGLKIGMGKANKVFDEMRITLSAFQAGINSGALINIAIAVAILAGAVIALTAIDVSTGLDALLMISVLVGEMLGAMKLLSGLSKSMGELTINLGPIITISIAIAILSAALIQLSKLSNDGAIRGAILLSVLLAELTGIAIILGEFGKEEGEFGKGMLSLVLMAVAVKILAGVVVQLSELDVNSAIKGAVSVAFLLAAVAGTAILLGKYGKKIGALGITTLLLAASIKSIAQVVDALGRLDAEIYNKGMNALGSLVTGMIVFAYALYKAPVAKLPVFGAGMLIVAAGLAAIATAAFILSRFSWTSLGKAGAAIGAILLVFIGASYLIKPLQIVALAVAMTILSTAMIGLAVSMALLSSLGWGGIFVGLVALAGLFTILGVAGLLLGPMIPVLLALSGTLFLFAAAVALLGTGSIALAAGLAALGPGLMAAAVGVGAALAMFIVSLLEGLAEILNALATFGDAIKNFLITLGLATIEMIVAIGPDLAEAIFVLCIDVLNILAKYIDPLIVAFDNFMDKFFDALYVELIPSVGDWLWRLVVEVADLLLLAIQGLLGSIPGIGGACNDAIQELRDNMTSYWNEVIDTRRLNRETARKMKELEDGLNDSVDGVNLAADGEKGAESYSEAFLKRLSAKNKEIAANAKEIPETFHNNQDELSVEGSESADAYGDSMTDGLDRFKMGLGSAGTELGDIIFAGTTPGFQSAFDTLGAYSFEAGEDISYGLFDGMISSESLTAEGSATLANTAMESLMESLDAHSPSRRAMNAGAMLGEGFVSGMAGYGRKAYASAREIGDESIDGLQDPLIALSQSVDDAFSLDPVIRPVIDMTDVEDGMAYLTDVTSPFSSVGFTPPYLPVASPTDDAQTRISVDNSGIEERLDALRSEINALGDSIQSLKVYLDKDTLVGEIGPDLNDIFGRRLQTAMRGGR